MMNGLMKIKIPPTGEITISETKAIKLNTYLYEKPLIDSSLTGITPVGQQAARPSIVWDDVNKRWLVYFFARDVDHPDIHLAYTRDFLNFYYIGKVLDRQYNWESYGVEKPHVIKYNNKYYMFYNAWPTSTSIKLGVAWSDDGINFTKNPNPILEDPEGTPRINSPAVMRWKDGNFYLYAYNAKGKQLVFKTTPDQFPFGWQLIGSIETKFFSFLSANPLYDDEIDKILLFANIMYPHPGDDSEPSPGYSCLGLFVCDEPLNCVWHGILLMSLKSDVENYPTRYIQRHVFAPGVVKYGDRYIVLFNAAETDWTTERIYRLDVGVEKQGTIQIKGGLSYTSGTGMYKELLRRPPGAKVVLKHVVAYAWQGTPSEIYLTVGDIPGNRDCIVVGTNGKLLEWSGDITINDESLYIYVKGTAPISVAYSIDIEVKPALDVIPIGKVRS
jgi:hypothetical protein